MTSSRTCSSKIKYNAVSFECGLDARERASRELRERNVSTRRLIPVRRRTLLPPMTAQLRLIETRPYRGADARQRLTVSACRLAHVRHSTTHRAHITTKPTSVAADDD